jgi:hypothetical protein
MYSHSLLRDLAICDEHNVLHCVLNSFLSCVDFAFIVGWLIPSEMVTGPMCNIPLLYSSLIFLSYIQQNTMVLTRVEMWVVGWGALLAALLKWKVMGWGWVMHWGWGCEGIRVAFLK